MTPPWREFPYEGVSLDIDGTLYSLGWFKLQLGLRRLGDVRVWIAMEKVRKRLRREGVQADEMGREVAEAMALRLGRPATEVAQKVEAMLSEDWPMLLGHVGPYAGVKPLLDALDAANVPVVLTSDYPGLHKATALGLDPARFLAVIDATATGGLKPRPEPYVAALEALGLVDAPERALHVGDSLELDVLGAAGVGMHTALVGPGKRSERRRDLGASPTWSFPSMDAFALAVIEALGGERFRPGCLGLAR